MQESEPTNWAKFKISSTTALAPEAIASSAQQLISSPVSQHIASTAGGSQQFTWSDVQNFRNTMTSTADAVTAANIGHILTHSTQFQNRWSSMMNLREVEWRPFECTYCSKRFKSKNNLRQHVRLHTGERPYVCEICNESFVQMSSLQHHRNKKHLDTSKLPPNNQEQPKLPGEI